MTDKTTKYRVDGYDSFSAESFPVGQYSTKEEAIEVAKKKGGQMTLMYVYAPDGQRIYTAGSY